MNPHPMQHPKLILASQSKTRMRLLQQAGIQFIAQSSQVDEDQLKSENTDLSQLLMAKLLAKAKALSLSRSNPNHYVLGADQTLSCVDTHFNKPRNKADAREQLQYLKGKTHQLHSAIAVVQNEKILFTHVDTAKMTMRNFSDSFLNTYLDTVDAEVLNSVGCYHYEGQGIQLFEKVEGDYFTILGLSLLPLLAFLRQTGMTMA